MAGQTSTQTRQDVQDHIKITIVAPLWRRHLDLKLRLKPLRSSRNSIIDLLNLLTHALSRWLRATRLATNNLSNDVGPILSLDGVFMGLYNN